jgi:hypothetical protein
VNHGYRRAKVAARRRRAGDECDDDPQTVGNTNCKESCLGLRRHTFWIIIQGHTPNAFKLQYVADNIRGSGAQTCIAIAEDTELSMVSTGKY